jgi:hypothetical protein
MAKKEIAVQVPPDDAHFLTAPPWRIQWSPICLTYEESDSVLAVDIPKGAAGPKLGKCSVEWLLIVRHNGYRCNDPR